MTKQEHINHWVNTADDDWQAVQALSTPVVRSALVFAHWTLEKLSKALWIRYSDKTPPATDTVAIILAATAFTLTPTQLLFTHHLEAAHDEVLEPDFEHPLQLQETPQQLLQQATSLRQQLLEELQKPIVIGEWEPAPQLLLLRQREDSATKAAETPGSFGRFWVLEGA